MCSSLVEVHGTSPESRLPSVEQFGARSALSHTLRSIEEHKINLLPQRIRCTDSMLFQIKRFGGNHTQVPKRCTSSRLFAVESWVVWGISRLFDCIKIRKMVTATCGTACDLYVTYLQNWSVQQVHGARFYRKFGSQQRGSLLIEAMNMPSIVFVIGFKRPKYLHISYSQRLDGNLYNSGWSIFKRYPGICICLCLREINVYGN